MLSCGVGIVAVAYGLASDDGACVGVIQEARDDCRLPRFDAKSPNATRCFHRLRGRSPLLIEGLIDEWPHLAWSFQDWQEELRNMTLPVRSARLTSLGGGQIEAEGVSGAEFFDRILDRDDILVFNTAHKDDVMRDMLKNSALEVPDLLTGVYANPVLSISGSRGGLQYHNHDESWLGLLVGEKRWFLQHPAWTPSSAHRRAAPEELALELGVVECLQRPGEVVYLPERWWHATYNTGDLVLGVGGNGPSDGLRGAVLRGDMDSLSRAVVSDETMDLPDLARAATLAGHMEVLQWLVDQDTSSETVSEMSKNAMFGAVRGGHTRILNHLLEQGATLDAGTWSGEWGKHDPMQEAARQGHVSVLALLQEHGGDIQGQPLIAAAAAGHVRALSWLEEHGADMRPPMPRNVVPMHVAFINGHVEVAEWLVERGDILHEADEYGVLPMHLAASRGNTEILGWLMKQDDLSTEARSELRDRAEHGGHAEVVQLLAEPVD